MELRPDEISAIIKHHIKNMDKKISYEEVGTVIFAGDGILRIHGLDNCIVNELLQHENGSYCLALNLENDYVSAVMMGNETDINEGDIIRRTGEIISVPVGEGLLGRVVNPLGKPIDGLGEIKYSKTRPIERIAPGIITRKSVKTPLQTGIKAIDSMIPIGRGQRELIIGDRQTGKTTIAIDTIINQKGKDVICIYVAIGQKKLYC